MEAFFEMEALTIQEAAPATDWSRRMLRHVERAGLIELQRSEAGYREDVPPAGWLRWEQDKHTKLLALASAIPATTHA